jgi:hypothetical protein
LRGCGFDVGCDAVRRYAGRWSTAATKDVDDFHFEGTPIDEALVRDLAGGGILAQRRNVEMVGQPPAFSTACPDAGNRRPVTSSLTVGFGFVS